MADERLTDEQLDKLLDVAIDGIQCGASESPWTGAVEHAQAMADDLRRVFAELRERRQRDAGKLRFILYRPDLTWEDDEDGTMIPVDGQDVTDNLYKDFTLRAGDFVWQDDDGTLFTWRLKDGEHD